MTAIERARLTMKWTRRELAEKAGVSYPTVLSAETERPPSDQVLFKLADALGVEPIALRDTEPAA